MSVKILGDAPAMAMSNLYQVWAGRLGDSHQFAIGQDLLQSLLKPPSDEAPQSSRHDGDGLFAEMPAETFDWSDAGGSSGGGNGGHHGAAHETGGGDGLTAALSLFKGFGHGDLDF